MNIILLPGLGFDETLVLFGNGTLVPDIKKTRKSSLDETERAVYGTCVKRKRNILRRDNSRVRRIDIDHPDRFVFNRYLFKQNDLNN